MNWKSFTWQWLVACAVSQLLQILLDGVAEWLASSAGLSGLMALNLGLLLLRLLSSALGGVAQWLVLKQWLPNCRSWVLATSLGSAIALLVIKLLWSVTLRPAASGMMGSMMPPMSVLPTFVLAGIAGLILGTAQWFVFRNRIPLAGWWVGLSAVGMVSQELIIGLIQNIIGPLGIDVTRGAWNPGYWAIAVLGVSGYALITSLFLTRSLRK